MQRRGVLRLDGDHARSGRRCLPRRRSADARPPPPTGHDDDVRIPARPRRSRGRRCPAPASTTGSLNGWTSTRPVSSSSTSRRWRTPSVGSVARGRRRRRSRASPRPSARRRPATSRRARRSRPPARPTRPPSAWLPAKIGSTPRRRSSSPSCAAASARTRTLNEPVRSGTARPLKRASDAELLGGARSPSATANVGWTRPAVSRGALDVGERNHRA